MMKNPLSKHPDRARSTAHPGATQVQDDAASARTVELARLLDGYLAELEAGRTPDKASLLAEHPSLAAPLEEALAGLEFIHRAGTCASEPPMQLGDFRIVREIGRGGMGVVYEAEQASLKRRVALKVLRFGPIVDEVAQRRFQREAETVGRLHHTNIVPIFAVGVEQGVSYYAMQFIEGRDLGRVALAAREGQRSLPFREVASWGLQAADALAHAHRRGVIHRDIKPSNLILDGDGRIWLTDFGLARRLDDVSLSLTGALLGTPRYMSPEQAAAAHQPVDHRTDVYSLGATLYELLTGRPIFEASSPHEVLSQILHTEPCAPRLVVPALPRDLETIVLKCIAKEPGRRYDTAEALAEDLRAFNEGRPILARRPRVRERAARWFRQHRRMAIVGAGSAVTALLVAAVGIAAWRSYRDAHRARLQLSSSDPSLLAEVLDEQDYPVIPRFALPQPKAIELPAGSYRVRISAPGMLSQNWPIDLAAREFRQHAVGLPPEWLWPPREIAPHPSMVQQVHLRDRTDFLVLLPRGRSPEGADSPARLRLVKGENGTPAWPRDLIFEAASCPPGRDLQEWLQFTGYGGVVSPFAETGVADRARDLNGDGTADLVLLSRSSPSLLAVSGATGQVLWWHRGHPPVPTGMDASGTWSSPPGTGFVVGQPAASTDLNGDGIPDVVACFRSNDETFASSAGLRRRIGGLSWLGAVSGRDGASLWMQPVEEAWSQYAFSSTDAGRVEPLAQPQVRRIDGRDVVLLPEQGRLRAWDAITGRPQWGPIDLGFPLARVPELVDLNADGQTEALVVHQRQAGANDNQASFELVVIDLPAGAVRWRRELLVMPSHHASEVASVITNLISTADLDGDGRPEVVAFVQRRPEVSRWWFGMTVLDGVSGRTRWEHELKINDLPQDIPDSVRFAVGPDLDADGRREIFTAIPDYDFIRGAHGIRTDALSGASGTRIWQRHHAGFSIRSLSWWRKGADGWPTLLVSGHRVSGNPEASLILEAGSGRPAHVLLGVANPQAADCDGDGIPDLIYPLPAAGAPRLAVVKGLPPESWKALEEWVAGPDGNRDGVQDFFGFEGETLVARSGRGGERLWSATAQTASALGFISTEPIIPSVTGTSPASILVAINVKREGAPERGLTAHTLAAFGAADGKLLWTARDFELGNGSHSGSSLSWSYDYPAVALADLDHDQHSEVLTVRHAGEGSARLTVLDGRDGRVRWSTPVVDGALVPDPQPAGPPLADFNGDGVLDFALILPPAQGGTSKGCQVNVLDGKDGRPLWPASFQLTAEQRNLAWPEPTLGDLDGDKVPEAAVLRHSGYDDARGGYVCELILLDGRTGQVRWILSWVAGFPEIWPPVFIQGSGTSPGYFVMGIIQQGSVSLVAVGASGTSQWKRSLKIPQNRLRAGSLAWRAADLDGDGRNELIYLDDGAICVSGGPAMEVLWRWQLPVGTEAFRVLPPAPPLHGQPPKLVVWAGHEVFGLDAATGQPHWRGRAPAQPLWGNSGVPDLKLVRIGSPATPPVMQFSSRFGANSHTAVRAAWPTDADGRYLPPRP